MSASLLQSSSNAGQSSRSPLLRKRKEFRAESYLIGALCAGLLHGAVLFGWNHSMVQGPEFEVRTGDVSVELTLVAAAPAAEAVEEPSAEPVIEPPPAVEPPPVPEPPPVTPPPPVPEPVPTPTPPEELVTPTPPPPVKVQRPQPAKTIPETRPLPARAPSRKTAVGDGSSAIPGNDATSARSSAGGRLRPSYLSNPQPSYPNESKRAGHQGVVFLLVRVDSKGAVSSARVIRSSGFPMLDERALSTVRDRWQFKPAQSAGLPIASEVTIPVRFALD